MRVIFESQLSRFSNVRVNDKFLLQGPNVQAMAEMAEAVDIPVIASGGVTTVADVVTLADTGVTGCIIGRALYEGTISLPEALRSAAQC